MENVLKQGYLRKAKLSAYSQSALKMNLLQAFEPMRWYVFGVRTGRPYIEYYDREESIFSESAINTFDISTCSKVTYNLGRMNKNHTFCILLADRILELTADSRESMLDWCNSVERNLKNMGILTSAEYDHVYEPFESLIGSKKKLSRSSFTDHPHEHSANGSSLLVDSEASAESDLPTLLTPEQNDTMPHRNHQCFLLDDGTEEMFHSSESNGKMGTNTGAVKHTARKKHGSGVLLHKKNKDMDDDEDTSYDANFESASFWLRNKKTLETDKSVLRFEPQNGNETPAVAQPRRRKSGSDSGVQPQSNYQLIDIPPPLPRRLSQMEPNTKNVDIKELDDGYQRIIDCKVLSEVNKSKTSDRSERFEQNKYGDKLVVEPKTAIHDKKMDLVDNCVSCNNNVQQSTHSSHHSRQQQKPGLSSTSRQGMPIYEPVTPQASISHVSTNSCSSVLTAQRKSRDAAAAVYYVPEEYCNIQESLSSVSCAAASVANKSTMQTDNIYHKIYFDNQPPPIPIRSMSSPATVAPVRIKTVNRPASDLVRRIPSPVLTTSKPDEDFKKACDRQQKRSYQPVPQSPLNVVTLKQSQVEMLKEEMGSAGVIIALPVPFCQEALAIVGAYDGVWIAGWDIRKGPRQYNRFHIGDRLLAINNIRVTSITMAQKYLRTIDTVNAELTIQRLPYAQVFIIKRSVEGESLGIKRDGGTAEIIYVDLNGLAAKHGLTKNAQNVIGDCICNWCLTEINNRSLNLFFKNSEIEHRLNAVGKDISFVVQPVDFIRELKKELKKLKNYKDFIVQ